MTTQDLIEYYVGLLILQYRALTNACATVALWIGEFVQNQIVSQVRDAFNLATAQGAQLNILGQYRGIPRVIFGISPGLFWALVGYLTPSPGSFPGWARYTYTTPPSDRWLRYADLDNVPYSLTDAQMRLMIQLKAAFDFWDGTLGNLDNILYSFFGTNVSVLDNQDMSMTYQHLTSDPDPNQLFEIAVTAGILPHNAGVSFSVVEV